MEMYPFIGIHHDNFPIYNTVTQKSSYVGCVLKAVNTADSFIIATAHSISFIIWRRCYSVDTVVS